MGSELVCTVRSGGKSSKGKALLETSEILFRGEPRLKIPLASVQAATARNGELHLKWDGGSAVFELGEQAAKWADKILHPKSTSQKLGVKPGLRISAIGIEEGSFLDDLNSAAAEFSPARALKNSDLIFFRAEEAAALARLAKLVPSLASAGALWIVYPKGKREIKESQVMAAGKAAGLVDVKVVRFSDTHTALKFVRPKRQR